MNLEGKNKEELMKIAKDLGYIVNNSMKKEEIKKVIEEHFATILSLEKNEETIEDTSDYEVFTESSAENTEETAENIDVITLDNSTISNEVIKEEEIVPPKFNPAPTKNNIKKKGILVHNGRVYKELSNGRGIYADNGQTFNISDIRR